MSAIAIFEKYIMPWQEDQEKVKKMNAPRMRFMLRQ